MTRRRHSFVDWTLKYNLPAGTEGWQQAQLAVLMDIRVLLEAIATKLGCEPERAPNDPMAKSVRLDLVRSCTCDRDLYSPRQQSTGAIGASKL